MGHISMMKKTKTMKKIIIVFVFSLFITFKFTAQVKDISFTFSPAAEYTWWDSQSGFKDGTLIGGKLGFGFGEYLELRGVYLQSLDLKTDFSDFGLTNFDEALFTSQDVKLTRWGGEFKANIGTNRLKPYFTIGTGVQNIEVDSKDFEQIYGSVGVGVTFNLAKRAVLSIEAKNTTYNFNAASSLLTNGDKVAFSVNDATTTTDRMSNWGLMGSLQFYLGGRKPGTLTELDEAYLNKFKGGFKGMQLVIEPSIAHISFDDKSLFRDTYMLGGYAGFDFNEYIGLRGFYFKATNDDEISTDFDKLSMYGIEFRARLNDGNGVTPYLILGGGYLNSSDNYVGEGNLNVDSGEFATGGLGLNIPLGRRVLISGGLRAMFTSGEDIANISAPNDIQTHLMYNAGIKFTIGGKSKAPSKVYDEKVANELSKQDQNNAEKIKALKDEYQLKVAGLEDEIKKAYESKDVDKALVLMEEKKETQEALKEVEKISVIENEKNSVAPSGTVIQMTPVEFESLIDRILKGINETPASDTPMLNQKVESKSTNIQLDNLKTRVDSLEKMILDSKKVEPTLLNSENTVDKKVKESNKSVQENRVIKETTVLDPAISNEKELQESKKKGNENNNNIAQSREGVNKDSFNSTEFKNVLVLNDSLNLKVVDSISIDFSEELKSAPYLSYKNSAAHVGYQFSNSGYVVVGAKANFTMGTSSFEFMPEVFAGFADKTVFGAAGNIVYPFLKENEKVQPYAGAGVGVLYNGDSTKGFYNVIVGAYLPFISENMYVDYTMKNGFDLNQFSIGYKLPF